MTDEEIVPMTSSFRLSVAIPVHNEETVLPELVRRTMGALDSVEGGPHEAVFVDDGSTDRTADMLEEAARRDARIVVVILSRNFGHQAALTAALDYVSGDATIVMDGDLQDSPETIPRFVEYYLQGYDVVYAQRVKRKEPWALRLCYFVFYRMMAKLSDIPLPLDSGDFGLLSRRVVDRLRRMPEHHRYLRGMRTWIGFRQIGIPVERDPRHSGKSKYGVLRLIRLASDGIFAFSIVPTARAAALMGLSAIALSMIYLLYALYAKLFLHVSPVGFTALIMVVTFLSGVLLLFLGVIGEYVGRIYEETKARPLYIVDRVSGGEAQRSGREGSRRNRSEQALKTGYLP